MLRHAPKAQHVCVSELAEHHCERIEPIHCTMIEAARQGKIVVRLKGGDPMVFGRTGEEAEALRAAGIAFEIVPGVTAALGAAAFAGIPLTHRSHASAVAFVTGHEVPGKPGSLLDWPGLARLPGTLVFYMGIARLDSLSAALVEHGMPPETPAAAIERATTPRQRVVTGTLAELPALAVAQGLAAPALIVVGSVTTLRDTLNWFERRPLFGQRVLVTRPAHQAAELIKRLEDLGATVASLPAVEVRELDDWSRLDQ